MYSDLDYISKWDSTPDVCSYNFSSSTTFGSLFNAAKTHAINQWSNAGISLNSLSSFDSYADIIIFGGTLDYLNNTIGLSIGDDADGITYFNASQQYVIMYGAITKVGKVFTDTVSVFIIDNTRNCSSQNYISSTATHELGHALGWMGHAPSGNVMYAYSNSVTILQNPDKLHLYQYYH